MNKYIDYINKHTVDEVVAAIVDNNRDIKKTIQSLRSSRTDYQIKTQQIQWKLEALLKQE
jgi:pyrimidine deaminase RibD-like protein